MPYDVVILCYCHSHSLLTRGGKHGSVVRAADSDSEDMRFNSRVRDPLCTSGPCDRLINSAVNKSCALPVIAPTHWKKTFLARTRPCQVTLASLRKKLNGMVVTLEAKVGCS